MSKPARGREITGDREYRKRQPLSCLRCPYHHLQPRARDPCTALPQPGYAGSSLHFLGKSWWKSHVFKKIKDKKKKKRHTSRSPSSNGVPCCVRRPLISRQFTRGNFDTGVFAHVPQLDNDVIFPSGLQLVQRVFHGTVAGFHFVAPLTLSY